MHKRVDCRWEFEEGLGLRMFLWPWVGEASTATFGARKEER